MVSCVFTLPPPIVYEVQPAGRWFEKYRLRNQGIDEEESSDEEEKEEKIESIIEEYEDLKRLDPKEWKDQDHYAVLGLRKLRYKATQKQIKAAHKWIVLKHHPDKRKAAGVSVDENNDYFSCITRAIDILGDKVKRRAYDSIDPTFDDYIPPNNNSSKQNFFEVFSSVFKENARWSVKKRVPEFGDINAPIEDVERFYTFWYNFESWREYSYLDEEDKEKAEDAYERRWMEKQNRAARLKRKKEEMQRIRQLVDNAYACDVRIKMYKEEKKRKREEEKARRIAAAQKLANDREAEERAKREEEQRIKEEEDRIKQEKLLAEKKQKDKDKKALKKERQKLKGFCSKNNYFSQDDDEKIKFMDEVDQICAAMNLMTIQQLNQTINESDDVTKGEQLIKMEIESYHDKLTQEKQKHMQAASKKKEGIKQSDNREWSYEEMQILIKAVNLFPAGTSKRWEVVSNYIKTHGNCAVVPTAKECLSRAKNLQESDLKKAANKNAFEKFKDQHKVEDNQGGASIEISQRYEQTWNSDEQKCLEQALKTYPSSTAQRWDKIAEAVPGRTKKECMLRYKDLVERVKAKKAVQQKKA